MQLRAELPVLTLLPLHLVAAPRLNAALLPPQVVSSVINVALPLVSGC